jgi:hypothetical protein
MPVKDCATLEAEIANDELSRLVIEIALREPVVPAAPTLDATEIQRAIRDAFREIVAQVELQAGNPLKSRSSRWAWRVVAFTFCAAIGSAATLIVSASHAPRPYALGSLTPPAPTKRLRRRSKRRVRVRNRRARRSLRRAALQLRRPRVRQPSACTSNKRRDGRAEAEAMTPREIVGPQERFERSGAQRLRDIRPITTRLWSAMMSEFSGLILAGGAMAMFAEPALVNFVAPGSLLYAGLVMSRRVTLPLRLPQTAGIRDWNYPSPVGRRPPHGGWLDLSGPRSQRA